MLGLTDTASLLPVTVVTKMLKKRAYRQQICEIEQASFTPVVMSLTGWFGRRANKMYKRLMSLLSFKWDQPYSKVMCKIRCHLSFAPPYCVSEVLDPPPVA